VAALDLPVKLLDLGQRWFTGDAVANSGEKLVVDVECYMGADDDGAPEPTALVFTNHGCYSHPADEGAAPDVPAELWLDDPERNWHVLGLRHVEWATSRAEIDRLSSLRGVIPPPAHMVSAALFGDPVIEGLARLSAAALPREHERYGLTLVDRSSAGHGTWFWAGCGDRPVPNRRAWWWRRRSEAMPPPSSVYLNAAFDVCSCPDPVGANHHGFRGVRAPELVPDIEGWAAQRVAALREVERRSWIDELASSFLVSDPREHPCGE
jgi:hypothetical protein